VILTSTASPYKFPAAVYQALTGKQLTDDFELLTRLQEYSGMPIHPALKDIDKREILHKDVIAADAIPDYVRSELEK
jgi:threonine synthase